MRLALTAAVVADIVLLTALRIAGVDDKLTLAFQAVLVVGFGALTLIDYRAALAIAVLELACGGASGHWTVFPGGVSGRIMIDSLVLLRGLAELGIRTRARQLHLGRYTVHALVLAVAIPAVWMTLGLVNGNAPGDVFGDGNGQFFFAFALAIAALAQGGDQGWLRKWLLVACAANAVLTLCVVLVALGGLAPLDPTLREILLVRLDMGGVLQTLPNGLPRLYLGSGLYLQVGMALVIWELLKQPRRAWPWLLLGLLAFDLAVSWTRGYWLGAVLAIAVVLLLGSSGFRRALQRVGVAAAIVLSLTVGGLWWWAPHCRTKSLIAQLASSGSVPTQRVRAPMRPRSSRPAC